MSKKIIVDAMGLSCPQPVLEAKRVLDTLSEGKVEILVDTVTSRENVARLGKTLGWKISREERPGGYCVLLEK